MSNEIKFPKQKKKKYINYIDKQKLKHVPI